MTVRAIGGLLIFNLFILAVGAGVLWDYVVGAGGRELVRLVGVAYLLGLCALMILMTFEIVVGVPMSVTTMLLSGAALIGLGVAVGRLRGFAAPGLHPPGWRVPGISLFAAAFVAGIVVYYESMFRADRLAGVVREWDSWAFWIPRAKELYESGRLEPEFLLVLQQGPSYPPGLATIQAGAFHAMGSADTVTLHLQYWFFAVGFAIAVIGLLAQRVRPAILFPLLLAFLIAPNLLEWSTTVYADVPLGYLVACAALLLILWIEEREPWQLAGASVLLSGAMLAKREGMLFAACVLLAGFVSSWTARRQLWRRLLAAGLIAFALTLPWRIWFTAHDFPGDGPDTGYLGAFSHLERLWPALKLTLTTLFDQDFWYFAPVIGVAAIVLALLARAWRISLYTGTFLVAAVAAATWAFWSNTALGLNQDEWAIRRFTVTIVLVLAVLTPLLLQRAWSSEPAWRAVGEGLGPDVLFSPSRLAWVVVLVGVLSHPGSILAGYSGSGLPGGAPSFPGSDSCAASPPANGGRVRVVVGYADSHPEATAMRDRASAAGLPDTEVEQDGCGRLRVFVDDLPSVAASRALVAEARAAGLTPTVERDPDE